MLILSRRIGETICIGNDITVTVLDVQGMQVRLGINAPKGVTIDREEIAIRKAAGAPKPIVKPVEAEPLYANRTEAEWRELLAEERSVSANPGSEDARHVGN